MTRGHAPTTPGQYCRLALVFLAFAIYGSLVPLDYRSVSTAEAVGRYLAAWQVPIRVESRSDWLANILLFMPPGFLMTGALAVGRPKRSVLTSLGVVTGTSAALGAGIEFAQIYFPSRTVSSRDVVAETLGGALGSAIWIGLRPWMRDSFPRVGRPGRTTWLLPAYLVSLVLAQLLPLDLSLSPATLYHKYRDGMILLIPSAVDVPDRFAAEAVPFFVAGLLLGHAGGRPCRPDKALAIGLGLAASVEGLELLVASRRFDATDILIGGFATAAGRMAIMASGPDAPRRSRLAWLGGWSAFVVMVSWRPFNFDLDARAWPARAGRGDLIPFLDYFHVPVMNAADQIFAKASLYMPIGMLLGTTVRQTLAAALLVAIPVELGQIALPGRVPSGGDVIVELAGAWIGHLTGLPTSRASDSIEARRPGR